METKIKNEAKNNWKKRAELLKRRMKEYHSILLIEAQRKFDNMENYEQYWSYYWFKRLKTCYNLFINIHEMHGVTLITKEIEIILRE